MNEHILNKKVKDTLESIDNIHRAEANPFLYEKIMESLEHDDAKDKKGFFWNYSFVRFAFIALIILILNILTYTNYKEKLEDALSTKTQTEKENYLKSFAIEYSIQNTTYNY